MGAGSLVALDSPDTYAELLRDAVLSRLNVLPPRFLACDKAVRSAYMGPSPRADGVESVPGFATKPDEAEWFLHMVARLATTRTAVLPSDADAAQDYALTKNAVFHRRERRALLTSLEGAAMSVGELPGASCQLVMLYAACRAKGWQKGPLLDAAARVASGGAEALRAENPELLRLPSDGSVPLYEGLDAVPVAAGGATSAAAASTIAGLQEQVRALKQQLQKRPVGDAGGGGGSGSSQQEAWASYASQLEEFLGLLRKVELQKVIGGSIVATDELRNSLRQSRMELYDDEYLGLLRWFQWMFEAGLLLEKKKDGAIEKLFNAELAEEMGKLETSFEAIAQLNEVPDESVSFVKLVARTFVSAVEDASEEEQQMLEAAGKDEDEQDDILDDLKRTMQMKIANAFSGQQEDMENLGVDSNGDVKDLSKRQRAIADKAALEEKAAAKGREKAEADRLAREQAQKETRLNAKAYARLVGADWLTRAFVEGSPERTALETYLTAFERHRTVKDILSGGGSRTKERSSTPRSVNTSIRASRFWKKK